MRNNLATTIGLVVGGAIAYAIVGDWDRSGRMIVVLVAALAFAALITAIVVSYMRYKRPEPVQPPAETPTRNPLLSRTGNLVFYMPPGTSTQGLLPYGYGQPEQPTYHPGQLVD